MASIATHMPTVETALLTGSSDGQYGTIQPAGLEANVTDAPATQQGPSNINEDEIENPDRPTGVKFAILLVCILIGDFLTGYDSSCVETLTPVITDEFGAVADLGWYGIAYLLASNMTMLIYGQWYSFFPMRTVFTISFLVFTAGAGVCAMAPSSAIFILGRAFSGLGSAGIFAGGSILVANTTSLRYRPIYQALSGGMECVAGSFGPVISGVIAHRFSWRVSFWIILPLGVAVILAVLSFVQRVERPEHADLKTAEKLKRLDLTGFVVYLPMAVSLTLGLQWAGIQYPWDDCRIILLLVVAGVLVIAFLAVESRAGEDSMFPLELLKQRTIGFACSYTFCNSATLFVIGYYLPIYFQAIRGASTTKSGLMFLPTAASLALSVVVAGPLTTIIGYYTPILIIGSAMMAIGTGMITTFNQTTPPAQWIAYQILYGTGLGLTFQQPYTAVQVVCPESKVPTALVTLSFTQEFGAIVALSVAQNIFVAQLSQRLTAEIPGLDPRTILDSGAVGLIDKVPWEYREQVLGIYNDVLKSVFSIAVVLTCLTMVGAIGMEWKSVKDEKEENEVEE